VLTAAGLFSSGPNYPNTRRPACARLTPIPILSPSGRVVSDPALSMSVHKESVMKTCLRVAVAMAALALAGEAVAGIPLVNATCPGKIEVHADEGGPIYINGKEGKLKKFNDNYFEAKGGGVTISLSINPDGSPSVSYTGKGGANGICTVK
jgi:hypothetical protein